MDRKTFHNYILLLTYAAVLVLVIVRLNTVLFIMRTLLRAFKPLLFGFAIAFVLKRPCHMFLRGWEHLLPSRAKRAAPALAVLCSYVSLFAVLALVVGFLVPQLYDSTRALADRIYDNLPAMKRALYDILSYLNLTASFELSAILPSLDDLVNGVVTTLTSALPHLLSFTGNIVSSTITAVTAFVFSVYMLAGNARMNSQCSRLLRAYVPAPLARTVSQVVALTSDTFTRFVSGQLLESCILGALCFVGMSVFRFPYAPLISVIIGVSALIPVAGAYIGALLSAFLLAMVSPMQALGFLVFLVVLQQLEGNLIYPKVVGSSIGLPALWVLTAVTAGGGLFGLWGMLLSVPTASVLYTLLRQDVNARLAAQKKN